jgi:Peptidase MA superfamily
MISPFPHLPRLSRFTQTGLRLIGGGLLLLGLVGPVHSASSQQSAITVDSTNVVHTFGGQMIFTLTAHAPSNLTDATLLMRAGTDARTEVISAQFDPAKQITTQVTLDLQATPIAPFANITYQWQLADANGDTFTTDEQSYFYEDNRFTWQTAIRGPIHAHWHSGDLAFGQAIADIGYDALNRASRLMAAPPPAKLDIYVYEQLADLQAGLRLGGRNWVGGHADPRIGVVMVYGTNDALDLLRLENDLSHELTHVMVYQIVGPGYNTMPVWLDEGLAVSSEPQPNPQYADALNTAVKTDALTPIAALCAPFGIDPGRAILAYAESASLVRYLQDRVGPQGIQQLLAAYRDGATCEGGVQRVLQISLPELQSEWEGDALRASPFLKIVRQALPYLLVFGPVLLVLVALLFVPRRKA